MSQFARYGVPDTLVTDNGPQFSSDAFKNYSKHLLPKLGAFASEDARQLMIFAGYLIYTYTRNELALLALSFYTCLKHQLLLASIIVLLSSTLDYGMHDVGSSVGQIVARAAQPAVYAHVHILADHVTLTR